jgi:hypothetical protein
VILGILWCAEERLCTIAFTLTRIELALRLLQVVGKTGYSSLIRFKSEHRVCPSFACSELS